ncbi:MAG TPA: DUF3575 domain-containing protein [Flavobacteriaceae bacterium]|nr:DUF3575 domain-containing protein [Flavobacteriaceae bacterium]
MRKTTFILLVCFSTLQVISQEDFAQHEIKLNIANTIAIASVELGYEYFFDNNQSLEAQVLINDRYNYGSEKGDRQFNTHSFQLGYNFYIIQEFQGTGFHISPFLKYRTGDFEETKAVTVGSNTFDEKVTTDMNSFLIGIGGGYKFNFGNQFVFGPYANIGRNFSDVVKERFSAIEFNAGFNIGYRF